MQLVFLEHLLCAKCRVKDSTSNIKSNFWMEIIISFSILQMRKLELSEVINLSPRNQ